MDNDNTFFNDQAISAANEVESQALTELIRGAKILSKDEELRDKILNDFICSITHENYLQCAHFGLGSPCPTSCVRVRNDLGLLCDGCWEKNGRALLDLTSCANCNMKKDISFPAYIIIGYIRFNFLICSQCTPDDFYSSRLELDFKGQAINEN